MRPTLSSKLPDVKTTIFTTMSQMALDHGALNLSQGFPDFEGPQQLRDLVTHHLNSGKNQYAPMTGIPKLREQIAKKVKELYGRTIDMDTEVTVTPGATEALFSAIHATVRPGDEVIIFDPAFDSYVPAIQLAGGKSVHINLQAPHFSIDWDLVKSKLTDKTRMIMINSPHNPTGSILTQSDMEALSNLVEGTNIFILSDEVYEHIIFDQQPHESVSRYENLAARSFIVSSFGKTYHVTGWKIGYCVAPPELSQEFRKVHQFVTFCTSHPVQHAIADFLEQCPEHHYELPNFYQKKRDKFCSLLEKSRFKLTPSQGTYFQLLDYNNINDLHDMDYVQKLVKESGIASIPITVFYKNPPKMNFLRFCFAKDDTTLEAAADILCQI